MKIVAIAGRYGKAEIPSELAGVSWVWVEKPAELSGHPDADCFIDLDFIPVEERILELSRLLPGPVLINSVVNTLEEIGYPFIRINAWPGMLERRIHELAVSDEKSRTAVHALYEKLGWQYRLVPDIAGMLSARVLATIINEACYTLEDQVSTREEIDAAMRLGTNYPRGPFEWAALIGEENVLALLQAMAHEDDRYQPCRLLATMAERN